MYVTMLQCDSSIHLCCKGVLIIFLMCRSGVGDFLEFTILFQNFVADIWIFAARGSGCATGNPVDNCWKCDANCAIGFGLGTIGGRNGRIYVVTSARDDSPANPAPGPLRHAVAKAGPLWIIFSYSMTVRLKNELLVTSHKTIGAAWRCVSPVALRASPPILHPSYKMQGGSSSQ